MIKTTFHNPSPHTIVYSEGDCAVLSIGSFSYAGESKIHRLKNDGTMVRIGKFCSIGPDVDFFSGKEYSIQMAATYLFAEKLPDWPDGETDKGCPMARGGIDIENDVWIGKNAMIRSGVRIHSGAVIGMGAVVTRDIPPYAVAVGNPAEIKRFRFQDEMVQRLLKLAWWDWPIDIVKDNAKILFSPLNSQTLDYLEGVAPHHEKP